VSTAWFRFDEGLGPFLRRDRRGAGFAYRCARAATLKNAILAGLALRTDALRAGARGVLKPPTPIGAGRPCKEQT
jgi:hypothetical protein